MRTENRDIASVEEMHALAASLTGRLFPGSIIGLSGPLGVGKTEFFRGICIAAGIPDYEITSPSYVIEQVYQARNHSFPVSEISHWDLYRIGEGVSVEEIRERASQGMIAFVEWPEQHPEVMQLLSMLLTFSHGTGEARRVSIEDIEIVT